MRILLVGGAVRDSLMGRPVSDRDYIVVGASEEEFLKKYPRAHRVGKDFPVYLVNGDEYAFARKERKTGKGHKGFETISDPSVTLEEDLKRRDLTINAIALDEDGHIIDPFGGQVDIEMRILRHVSQAFSEDPLRVFRVARFAATLGFNISMDTMDLMKGLKDELPSLSAERVFWEMRKALDGRYPRRFFDTLREANCLDYWFEPVVRLIGVEQPKRWHPEGDVYEHTMIMLDRFAGDSLVGFAALCHDFGKGVTPREEWPRHHGHEEKGIPIIRDWCNFLPIPNMWKKIAIQTAYYHKKAITTKVPGKLVRLAKMVDIYWAYIEQVIKADATTDTKATNTQKGIDRIELALEVIHQISGSEVIEKWPNITGKEFGERLHELRAKELRRRMR